MKIFIKILYFLIFLVDFFPKMLGLDPDLVKKQTYPKH